MEIWIKVLALVGSVTLVGVLAVRDMEKSSTTEVGAWSLNIPASVTAGALALLGGAIAIYFLF